MRRTVRVVWAEDQTGLRCPVVHALSTCARALAVAGSNLHPRAAGGDLGFAGSRPLIRPGRGEAVEIQGRAASRFRPGG